MSQARALFDQMADIRAWNSSHGGVYVPVTETTPPTPSSRRRPGRHDHHAGRRLTLLNHAYMTRQLAEITRERRGVSLHLTSLNAAAPGKRARPWERTRSRRSSGASAARGVPHPRRRARPFATWPPFRRGLLPPLPRASRATGWGRCAAAFPSATPPELLAASRRAFRRNALATSVVLWSLAAALIAAVTRPTTRRASWSGRLRELALVDELTGLHNRRGFLVLAEKQLQIARRASGPTCCSSSISTA